MRLPLTDEITVWGLFAIGVAMVVTGFMDLTGGVDFVRGDGAMAVGVGTVLLLIAPVYRRQSVLEAKQKERSG